MLSLISGCVIPADFDSSMRGGLILRRTQLRPDQGPSQTGKNPSEGQQGKVVIVIIPREYL